MDKCRANNDGILFIYEKEADWKDIFTEQYNYKKFRGPEKWKLH